MDGYKKLSLYQRFALDLFKESSWDPLQPADVMSSLCLVVAEEKKVSLRLLEGASDASEGGMVLNALRDLDWWHPKGGKLVKLEGKGKKPICEGTGS